MSVLILDCGSIPGESTIKGFEGKIEVYSFSHGVSQAITADSTNAKRTTGKANFQDLSVMKTFDLASPGLIEHCTRGTVLPTVKLTMCRSVSGAITPFLVYTLTNVLVSSVSESASSGGDDRPTESVTFNYSAISWAYTSQTSAGGAGPSASTTWNLATNSLT